MKFENLKRFASIVLAIAMLAFCGVSLAESDTATDETADMDTEGMHEEIAENLGGLEETESVAADGEAIMDSEVFNVLLIGTDERSAEYNDDARGDCCMLFSVNTTDKSVKLISFERGTGVPVLSGEYEGNWDWLTHTFKYGGADLMLREISENFKINVNYYVRVNLTTFVQAIDAIGGVDIDITSAEAGYINSDFGIGTAGEIGYAGEVMNAAEGTMHMNGATALVYSRCRKIDSDWSRIERQRKVIKAVMAQLQTMDSETVINLLTTLLPTVKTNITTDSASIIIRAIPTLLGGTVDDMTIPAPGTYGSKKGMGGRDYYSVNFDQCAELINEFLYGSTGA